MKNILRALGLKTALLMGIDIILVATSLFTGILSALAFDHDPWCLKFWILALIGIICDIATSVIGWWAWYELRYKTNEVKLT
jgi:hypothetical protein